MDNNNNANLLNITYGKYPKLCEKTMTRNVNNNTVGNTHQSAVEMQVSKPGAKFSFCLIFCFRYNLINKNNQVIQFQ